MTKTRQCTYVKVCKIRWQVKIQCVMGIGLIHWFQGNSQAHFKFVVVSYCIFCPNFHSNDSFYKTITFYVVIYIPVECRDYGQDESFSILYSKKCFLPPWDYSQIGKEHGRKWTESNEIIYNHSTDQCQKVNITRFSDTSSSALSTRVEVICIHVVCICICSLTYTHTWCGMFCHVISCHAVSCHVMSCLVML